MTVKILFFSLLREIVGKEEVELQVNFEPCTVGSILNQVYDMCDEGAMLYAFFTPTWAAHNGHHWSHFPTTLPSYIHIHFSHREFIEWCERHHNLSIEDAEIHAHQIFKSTRINRLTPIEWNSVFERMKFKKVAVNEIGKRDLSKISGLNLKNVVNALGTVHACDGYRLIAKR